MCAAQLAAFLRDYETRTKSAGKSEIGYARFGDLNV